MRNPRPRVPQLVDEPPVRFHPSVARAIGSLPAAVLLERVWELTCSPRARRREHEGRVFVFYPARVMAEDLSFLRVKTLRRAVARLKARGLLIQARSRDGGHERAGWYSVRKEAVEAIDSLFPTTTTTAAPGTARQPTQRRRDDAAKD